MKKAATKEEKAAARDKVRAAKKSLRELQKRAIKMGAARVRRRRYHHRRMRGRWTPEIENYRVWSHDFDTAVHGLIRNPAAVTLSPKEFVERCVAIANEMRAAQEPLRPKNYDRW